MAAVFDQVVSSTDVNTSSEDIGPITPGGSDRFLVWGDVLGQTGSTRTLNSITHDSVTGDSRWDTGRFGGYYQTHCHTITGPNAASSVVTGAFSGSSDHGGGIVATFTGVDQTTPFEGLTSSQANDDAPDIDVTSETDDLVVDFIGGDGQTLSVSGGGTEIAALPHIASYAGCGMAYEAGAASVNRTWTWTDGPYYFHGFNLNAAGGANLEDHDYSGVGTLTFSKTVTFVNKPAMSGVGTSGLVLQVVKILGMAGVGTASLVKRIIKVPFTSSGVGTQALSTTYIQPKSLSQSGVGTSGFSKQFSSGAAAVRKAYRGFHLWVRGFF